MYYSNKDIRIEKLSIPEPGPGELLIKVMASGICGSDVMEWYRIGKAPRVLGHEVAGEIIALGKGVKDYQVGERIFASHHVPCNTCRYCLRGHHTACETLLYRSGFDPGGFSEYLRLTPLIVERGVYVLPDEVSYEDATFIEPLACVVRGQRMVRVSPGDSVLVIGSGIAGLLHIQFARACGAGFIAATDLLEYRLKAAERFGADIAIHAEEDLKTRLRRLNNGLLADVVIICTGAKSAILQGLQSVERGGSILLFAPTDPGVTIPVSINELFFRNDVTITTSYGGSPEDCMVALELIRRGRVRVSEMITHRLSLAETGLGFQLVSRADRSIKVIIEPQRKFTLSKEV
jgi:L-iditol 2-dehydrogenase